MLDEEEESLFKFSVSFSLVYLICFIASNFLSYCKTNLFQCEFYHWSAVRDFLFLVKMFLLCQIVGINSAY